MSLRKRQEITGHLSTMQEISAQMVKFVKSHILLVLFGRKNGQRWMNFARISAVDKTGTWNIR